jgi:hypothetical protein
LAALQRLLAGHEVSAARFGQRGFDQQPGDRDPELGGAVAQLLALGFGELDLDRLAGDRLAGTPTGTWRGQRLKVGHRRPPVAQRSDPPSGRDRAC